MTAEDFIKIRKEGGNHPKFPKIPSRACSCGNPILNSGESEEKGEEGDLLYQRQCWKCLSKPRFTNQELEDLNVRIESERTYFHEKKSCSMCNASKPMPAGKWCAPCCIKKHSKDIQEGKSTETTLWALNYAMRFL